MHTAWLSVSLIFLTTAMSMADPTPGECWGDYVDRKGRCESEYSNDDNPNHQNQSAYQSCLNGANGALHACLDGADDGMWGAWEDFLQRLDHCLDTNHDDPAGLESCLEAAFAVYQAELEDILNPDDDDCGPADEGIDQMSPVYTLVQGSIEEGRTDGKYPVTVQSTVTFTAGVNPSAGTAYDIGQHPCLKNALSIAIYSNKNGAKIIVYDGDTDTSDGASFSLPLFQSELIDAHEVHIINIFYDQNAMPRFAEHGMLVIEDSPLSGDWNRDNVTDPQDMIDYLSSFGAQTGRADVNNDGEVDQDDMAEFVEDYDN